MEQHGVDFGKIVEQTDFRRVRNDHRVIVQIRLCFRRFRIRVDVGD